MVTWATISIDAEQTARARRAATAQAIWKKPRPVHAMGRMSLPTYPRFGEQGQWLEWAACSISCPAGVST
jgi:hypothetical protein